MTRTGGSDSPACRSRTEWIRPASTITGAASLTGHLLLNHGMAGDNVVGAHPLRMSAALLADGPEH